MSQSGLDRGPENGFSNKPILLIVCETKRRPKVLEAIHLPWRALGRGMRPWMPPRCLTSLWGEYYVSFSAPP